MDSGVFGRYFFGRNTRRGGLDPCEGRWLGQGKRELGAVLLEKVELQWKQAGKESFSGMYIQYDS